MLKVEIITIGTELIVGLIINTNATWLAKKLTELGCYVTRIVTVRDDEEEISSVIHEAFKRADLVITSGGLGPTEDDLTLKAVAKAFNKKLVLDPEAKRIVEKRYKQLYEEGILDSPELTPSRLKMAYIPEGSKPLDNPVGAAPGVYLEVNKKVLICLPGVPKELQSIFEKYVKPLIMEKTKRKVSLSVKILTNARDESKLANIIKKLTKTFPEAYIKSHASKFEGNEGIPITVTVFAKDIGEARQKIMEIVGEASKLLEEHGYLVLGTIDLSIT